MKKTLAYLIIFVMVFLGATQFMRLITTHDLLLPHLEAVIPSPTPTLEILGTPKKLSIPKLAINASIESVGIDSQGRMDVPQNPANVAWYKFGPEPGQPGNAVIDGHLDTPQGLPAVFANLSELSKSDTMSITYDTGKIITFQVTRVKSYAVDSMPLSDIFHSSATVAKLNLITCAGTWNHNEKQYSDRLVVYTQQVPTHSL